MILLCSKKRTRMGLALVLLRCPVVCVTSILLALLGCQLCRCRPHKPLLCSWLQSLSLSLTPWTRTDSTSWSTPVDLSSLSFCLILQAFCSMMLVAVLLTFFSETSLLTQVYLPSPQSVSDNRPSSFPMKFSWSGTLLQLICFGYQGVHKLCCFSSAGTGWLGKTHQFTSFL